MSTKAPAAIITGTIARPSRPSVKFTALAAPAMTKPPTRMKSEAQRDAAAALKNGTASDALQRLSSTCMISQVARNATPNSTSRRSLPLMPADERLVTLR